MREINAFADYGLIFGAFGLPKLGVEGAAIATCISSWLGPVLILIFSAFEKNLLMGPVRELFTFSWKQLGYLPLRRVRRARSTRRRFPSRSTKDSGRSAC